MEENSLVVVEPGKNGAVGERQEGGCSNGTEHYLKKSVKWPLYRAAIPTHLYFVFANTPAPRSCTRKDLQTVCSQSGCNESMQFLYY